MNNELIRKERFSMAVAKRVSREIKDPKDIEYLVKLTEDDITTSLIMELFGDFGDQTSDGNAGYLCSFGCGLGRIVGDY